MSYLSGWFDVDGTPVLQADQDSVNAHPGYSLIQPLQPLGEDFIQGFGPTFPAPGFDIPEADIPPKVDIPPPKGIIPRDPQWTKNSKYNKYRQIPPEWKIWELPGSGKITFNRNGQTGERTFCMPWVFPNNRTYLDFCQILLGWTFPDSSNGRDVIIPPDVFSNELNWLLCQELEVEGLDGSIAGNEGTLVSGLGNSGGKADKVLDWPTIAQQAAAGGLFPNFNNAQNLFPTPGNLTANVYPAPLFPRVMYEFAVVKAKYAPFDINENISLSGQALTRPGNLFVFTSPDDPDVPPDLATAPGSGVRLDDSLSKIFPMAEHTIERKQIWEMGLQNIMPLIGCVNQSQFLQYNPRTLLFLGLEATKSYFPSGTRVWDVKLKFQYNPREHVKILRKDRGFEGQWWYVKTAATGDFLYDLADLNTLLLWGY